MIQDTINELHLERMNKVEADYIISLLKPILCEFYDRRKAITLCDYVHGKCIQYRSLARSSFNHRIDIVECSGDVLLVYFHCVTFYSRMKLSTTMKHRERSRLICYLHDLNAQYLEFIG
jgi:hypothetical protein